MIARTKKEKNLGDFLEAFFPERKEKIHNQISQNNERNTDNREEYEEGPDDSFFNKIFNRHRKFSSSEVVGSKASLPAQPPRRSRGIRLAKPWLFC